MPVLKRGSRKIPLGLSLIGPWLVHPDFGEQVQVPNALLTLAMVLAPP